MRKAAREFRYGADDSCPEVIEYLRGLGTERNPFGCPRLRVLAEDIKVIHEDAPPERYATGDLMCVYLAENEITRRCGGPLNKPRIDTAGGSLAFDCRYAPGGAVAIQLGKPNL